MENQKNEIQQNMTIIEWLQRIGGAILFPVFIIYLEFVMAMSTTGDKSAYHWVCVVLFSLGYGFLAYFVGILFPKRWINFLVQLVELLAFTILYISIYFVYCEFRIFYDLNTMLAGASDAATSFRGDVVSMVSSSNGQIHIALFCLPLLIYLLLGWIVGTSNPIRMGNKVSVVLIGLLFVFAGSCCVCTYETERELYTVDYNFGTTISNYGVLTALRKDIPIYLGEQEDSLEFVLEEKDVKNDEPKKLIAEKKDSDEKETEKKEVTEKKAENENKKDTDKKEDVRESVSEDIVVSKEQPSGKNEMDIDFEALMQKDGEQYAELDAYVMEQEASNKNEYTGLFEGKNLIFLTAEAFTYEAIDRFRTPTLYRLATRGMQFTDYYQPASAGTTGGEYSNLFGMLPTAGGSSVKKTQNHYNWTTIASRLTEKGYYGKAYHNNDYTYYDRHKTHINLGYSDGYTGKGNGLEESLTSEWPESDAEMLKATLSEYVKKQPFNIYYMTVSGHSLYTFEKNAQARKHREEVEGMQRSEPVKAYLAAQIELEEAMSYLVGQLERMKMADDTVIVISADHFPYGLDQDSNNLTYLQELYQTPIEDTFVRDHNRLIIWSGCLEKEDPIVVDSPTSSIDILPTLCNLFGVEYDSRLLPGRDVFSDTEPLVFNLGSDFKTEKGTYIAAKGRFIPARGVGEVSKEYISEMQAIVRNKITYSKGVLNQDYFRHVFGE